MELETPKGKCCNCGCPCNIDICEECENIFNDYDTYDDQYEDEEPDYHDFDCTCGAWHWSEKQGKPIHIADCICGSNEPWT